MRDRPLAARRSLGSHSLWKRLLGALLTLLCSLPAASAGPADNPYLQARDDRPISVELQGTEWGDDIDGGERRLAARMTTTRIATLPFGAVFRVEFVALPTGGAMPRALPRWLLLATASEIALLPGEAEEATLQKLRALATAPPVAAQDVRAIARGSRRLASAPARQTRIHVEGSRCTYRRTHPSGHFTTLVWQRGVGLIEYAEGRGARADGFRLRLRGGVTK